jgi:quercetin dioxygenase-like cupin family protein
MDIVKFEDLSDHTVPEQDDIALRQFQYDEAGSANFVLIGHTTFSPAARLLMEATPVGKIYVVAEGALTVEQADGVRHVLNQGDSTFVPADEACAVVNDSGKSAELIVISPPSDK